VVGPSEHHPRGAAGIGPGPDAVYHINDIVNVCHNRCSVKLFADDTLIYVTGNSTTELECRMSRAFNSVEEWLDVNGLKMNADKTKYMIIKSVRKVQRGNIALKCADGTLIQRVESIKYLGVVIDDTLRFADHCNYILKKVGKKISFLNRIGD